MKSNLTEYYNDKLFISILKGINLIDSWGDVLYFEPYKWKIMLGNIRFINFKNEFDYAEYGDYFFIDDNLYILSENECYKSFSLNDVKLPEYIHNKSKYLTRGVFAGFDTLKRDSMFRKVYYGDILKIQIDNLSKCNSCYYFENNLDFLLKRKSFNFVYGPLTFASWRYGASICHNPTEDFRITDQSFGLNPNFCASINTQIVANLYYDFRFEHNNKFCISIVNNAILSDTGYTSKFWFDFVSTDIIKERSFERIWESAIHQYMSGHKIDGGKVELRLK